jgi:hypothetical protein
MAEQLDHGAWHQLQLKRLQRAVEYALLVAMHLFFLISFRGLYEWWMAAMLGVIMFGLNFQLTQLRERRRLAGVSSRQRLLADTLESILFLGFIVALSLGESYGRSHQISDQEYLAYVAAILGGIFLAGLAGELYWQRKFLRSLDQSEQQTYIANLKRTIILPYLASRPRQ